MECTTEQPNKFARNHRPAEMYAFNGGKATIAEIATAKGMSFPAVWRRIQAGKSLDAPKGKQGPKGGRPSRTFTFTAEQLGALLGISPSAVLKRDERGQNLLAQRRYGVIKDVTEEPKNKAVATVDPVAVRARDVSEIEAGSKVPGNAQTLTSMLLAAWDAGYNTGARR